MDGWVTMNQMNVIVKTRAKNIKEVKAVQGVVD